MPKTRDFRLHILVGGVPVPEFEKDGQHYVECNLFSPYSYQQRVSESVGGCQEEQLSPVTPYQVSLKAGSWKGDLLEAGDKYFRIFVDGVKVKGLSLRPGETKIIRGFRDGPVIREFLFSLPRFATSEVDRVDERRVSSIGLIEVECWDARLRKSEWKVRQKDLNFQQANKKDSYKVTNGEYTMATSRAGKAVSSRSLMRNVDCWKRVSLRSRIGVKYVMNHTLQEMGFAVPHQSTTSSNLSRKRKIRDRPTCGKSKKTECVSEPSTSANYAAEGDALSVVKEEPGITFSEAHHGRSEPVVVNLISDSEDDDEADIDYRPLNGQHGRVLGNESTISDEDLQQLDKDLNQDTTDRSKLERRNNNSDRDLDDAPKTNDELQEEITEGASCSESRNRGSAGDEVQANKDSILGKDMDQDRVSISEGTDKEPGRDCDGQEAKGSPLESSLHSTSKRSDDSDVYQTVESVS